MASCVITPKYFCSSLGTITFRNPALASIALRMVYPYKESIVALQSTIGCAGLIIL